MANIKDNKKFHYIYKTTNLVNERYYLGMHSTNHLNDGYLGSGKRLYYELNKYGKDNFKIEILHYFNSREELIQAEIVLITEQDINNPNCLNLKKGGSGGFSKEQVIKGRELANKARLKLLKEDLEFKKKFGESVRKGLKRAKEKGVKFSNIQDNFSWLGKKHKNETIEKMKNVRIVKELSKGESNSQYGTCWITNETESKKISKGSLIPEGWRLGRKIKK
jgi:hypothetical protein